MANNVWIRLISHWDRSWQAVWTWDHVSKTSEQDSRLVVVWFQQTRRKMGRDQMCNIICFKTKTKKKNFCCVVTLVLSIFMSSVTTIFYYTYLIVLQICKNVFMCYNDTQSQGFFFFLPSVGTTLSNTCFR